MPSAMAELETCIPALRRYARSLLGNSEEADDLVHDCIVRALDQLHTWRQDGNMRAWLFSILHNLFVTQARRRHAHPAVPIETVPDDWLELQPRQDDHISAQDMLRALGQLPEEQRTVLLLVSVEDLSYAETARVLDIPLGTVMSRLSRAREKLRRCVEGEAYPPLRRVK